ncbi:MAG TPA: DUF2723 domain-containing protein [Burkholderiales bacterium]|nr:DUF2723 domain-containing protein [Burkholderiales bacterium]
MARRDWLEAGVIALALFALYAATAPRTIALEDDGLFVLGAYFLGNGHPPGYPLFMLIGKLFTYLPFGSVAYRVHLVSAFFGGLTCAGLWLCARCLAPGRLPAYLAAFGLALSPVFWSQATIAEVYTLNTFFFVTLTLLALRGAPLPWIAFVYGLSLTNHWPLMGLVTPAFFALLWPRRFELLRRLPLLFVLAVIGLAPYAWMVVRSWQWLPISYHGPIESFAEFWYVLSRKGYAHVDASVSWSWLDRIKFFEFMVGQLFYQLAVAGTLLAALGCAVQRRVLGAPKALFLTIAFVMPSFGLLMMLRFDYDALLKHVFHVYPLPAYVAAALWMAIGLAWLIERYRLRQPLATAAGFGTLALVAIVGGQANLFTDEEWGARYAKTVLSILPKDAVLFVRGDVDLAPIGYFYLVEGWRPDIELYHSAGRVLGNRLFLPLRTTTEEAQAIMGKFIDEKQVPVTFTLESYSGYASRDHWLYMEVDKSSRDPQKVTIDIPEEAVRFFEESVASVKEPNAWVAFHQDELRRRYGSLLGHRLPRRSPPDARMRRHFELLSANYFGALGLAEGMMLNKDGYSTTEVTRMLERAAALTPTDASKSHKSRYFYLRAALRLDVGDKAGAVGDFQASLDVWPSPDNPAIRPLKDIYQAAGDTRSLQALDERLSLSKH